MPFIASPALIHCHALCLELRVLIEIFPSVILRLISHLRLPGMMLACVVLRVRLKWRNLVEVFVSFVAHVLVFVLLSVVLSEESWLRHLQFDALTSLVVILLVELEADEVALGLYAAYLRRSHSRKRV